MTKQLLNSFIFCLTLAYAGTAQVQLISDFTFDGNLNDSQGNATISLMNDGNYSYNNGTFTNGVDSTGAAPGLKVALPDVVFDEQEYTIQIDFSFSETSGYRKILDYSLLQFDAGLYVNGQLRLYSAGNYGPTTIAVDSIMTIYITRNNALDSASVYLANGASLQVESSATDLTGEFVAELEGANRVLHFFHDDTTTVSEFSSSFTVDRIRIWNGDYTAVLGLNEKPSVSFSCFPNPASTIATVRFTEPVNDVLEIVSAEGRVLNVIPVSNQTEVEIPMEQLSDGIYLIRCKQEVVRLLKK